jgi:hypothetical protein
MGYTVEQATSLSIGLNSKPKGSKASTTIVINVVALLDAKANDRAKLLKEWANCELSGSAIKAVKEAKTVEELLAGLERRISKRTPNLLPVGTLYLQPTEERRRSGSHYTPRKLTQPIVETTFRPVYEAIKPTVETALQTVLEGLGNQPSSEQLLNLKVCDLAMGSGAFLVEACRQLADKVVEAWSRERQGTKNEEPLLLARRLVARRCLYGVDKNPFAVSLAKLSLWLFTLSKDEAFTFLDHTLRQGDSLLGVLDEQRSKFLSFSDLNHAPLMNQLKENREKKRFYDEMIRMSDGTEEQQREHYDQSQSELHELKTVGDINIFAFLSSIQTTTPSEEKLIRDIGLASTLLTSGKNKKDAKKINKQLATEVVYWQAGMRSISDLEKIASVLHTFDKPVIPFHWEDEFSDVFNRENPGFDVIVGNPPFAGKNTLIDSNVEGYGDWLKEIHPESHGNSDLVAHFFRRAFRLLREGGAFGLIATNTIAQGDTRTTGLRWICQHKGTIYNAQKRVKWTGQAAVVVSVINVFKGEYEGKRELDGKEVPLISAFLFPKGESEDPKVLLANAEKSFQGSIVLGMGFTFDDTNEKATSISEMNQLIEKDPCNAERIFPYIGGEEVNSNPSHAYHRYVINFFDMSEEEAWKYPDLMQIVKDKVKPERDVQKRDALRVRWWQYAEKRPGLVRAIAPLDRVLVCAQTSKYRMFTFLPNNYVFDQKLVVFALYQFSAFASLHSRIHEVWAIFFGSSMKDDPVYTPTDCFQTFPFPPNWETDRTLEEIGKQYYEYRADLMIRNNQGLTDTYNRFHDPNETDPDILTLRDLHEKLDRAVLDAYGWHDLPTDCEFRLDYEDEDPDPSSKRKKPWRYRWAEPLHDEVLARLLDLNQQRHQQEILGGDHAEKKSKGQKAKSKKSEVPKNQPSEQLNLEIT